MYQQTVVNGSSWNSPGKALLFINPTAQLFCGRISQLHDDNGGFLSVPVIEFDGPNPVLV
jgi:hypothetical protein